MTQGGTLYIVATPIGNLGDVTLRALDMLRQVPLVAAEDTRLTRRLWSRHGIDTKLVSYHAHSPPARLEELVAHLSSGQDLALVTDAGTPLISDPGEGLVAAWAGRGGQVIPIPGASAVLAALAASALPVARWGFEGFLPRRGAERRERLARIAADDRATVLFEAANRTAATLLDLAAVCGAERRAAVSRELTKLHEETLRGTLGELAARVAGKSLRGEVTLVVAGADSSSAAQDDEPPGRALERLAAGRARVAALAGEGLSRSAAAREVARETGLPRRALFAHAVANDEATAAGAVGRDEAADDEAAAGEAPQEMRR
ncbi:MAG: 16S rRNA (cytidine(1402)-2'-O)-methyltransferase [Chloroflexi bacterium]|nr:16S rRNA (cytidine(1402)-2'-O)-methyltransferase [Chloroflexota bacterium]